MKKVIYISNNLEKIDTLPEEFSHFLMKVIKSSDPQLYQEMIEEAEKSELFKEVVEEYGAAYGYNMDQLREETAAKLLGQAIVSKFESLNHESQDLNWFESFLDIINRAIKKFMSMFSRMKVSDIQATQDNIFGQTAARALAKEFDFSTIAEAKEPMFQLNKHMSDMEHLQKLVKEAVYTITQKDKRFKNSPGANDSFEQLLNSMHQNINADKHLAAMMEFHNKAVLDINGIHNRMNTLITGLDVESMSTADLKALSKTLGIYLTYTQAYKQTLHQFSIWANTRFPNSRTSPRFMKFNEILDQTLGKIEKIDTMYTEASLPIVAKFLGMYAPTNGFVYQAYGDAWVTVAEALKTADKDISILSRLFDSMADSHDAVLQLIDVAVKDYKNRARNEGLKRHKRLVAMHNTLKENGVTNTEFMYEVSGGQTTGNLVTKFDYHKFNNTVKAFYEGNPTPQQIARFWSDHTEPIDDVLKVIQDKHQEFIAAYGPNNGLVMYNQWFDANTTSFRGQISYIKELTQPKKSMYGNPQYDAIMNNPTMKKFYEDFMELHIEMMKDLPPAYRNWRKAPQIRQDLWERLTTSSGNKVTMLKESIAESFLLTEDETEFGMTDEMGNLVKSVPIHFTKSIGHWEYDYKQPVQGQYETDDEFKVRVDNFDKGSKKNGQRVVDVGAIPVEDRKFVETPQFLSKDLISTSIAFGYMATNYKNMTEIVDILEMTKDIVEVRHTPLTNSKGKALMDATASKLGLAKSARKEGTSESFVRLEEYLNMVVYGQMKNREGAWNILGASVDKAKVLDALGKWTSLNSLALNVYAGISNVAYAQTQIHIEAVAGQYFNQKQLAQADALYFSNLGGLVKDLGSVNPTSKISLLFEKLNVFNDYEANVADIDAGRSRAARLMNTNSLYFLSKSGEHMIQGTSAIALMLNTKVMKTDGTETNMWEAYEVVDGVLKIKDDVILDEVSETKFILKNQQLSNTLNGVYNQIDKSTIQKTAVGRLAIMFRKFMPPGIKKRWGHKQYSIIMETMTEGQYITTLGLLKKIGKDLSSAKAIWNQLEPWERANVIRTITEAMYAVGAFVLMYALSSLSGDEDDDWALNMMAYQVTRLNSELQFYANPIEALKILKSPSASITQIERMFKFVSSFADLMTLPFGGELDVIDRGSWKGTTNLERDFLNLVPLQKSLHDLLVPHEKLAYFRLK
jgi:hypothetical protein